MHAVPVMCLLTRSFIPKSAETGVDLSQQLAVKFRIVKSHAPYTIQVVVIYIQLASLLGLLNIPWPSVMSGLFKAASWIMQVSPQVL